MAADTNLDQKIAEAKAAGYTDEEIQAYLNPQTPIQQPKDRSEEYEGMAEFGGGNALVEGGKLAAKGYLGYKVAEAAGKGIGKMMNKPPVAPTTFTGGANPAWDAALSKPFNPAAPQGAPAVEPPPVGGPAAQQGTTFLERFGQKLGQMRQAVAPVLEAYGPTAARVAGTAAAALTPGNVGQNYGAQFPQTGPMAGSELNPQTHRPWTPQELAAYNAQYR